MVNDDETKLGWESMDEKSSVGDGSAGVEMKPSRGVVTATSDKGIAVGSVKSPCAQSEAAEASIIAAITKVLMLLE